MRVYWVAFEGPGLGCGVTAMNEADCRVLVEDNSFFSGRIITSITEIKSLDEIDQSHVLPNIGNIFMRGVWFPNGI